MRKFGGFQAGFSGNGVGSCLNVLTLADNAHCHSLSGGDFMDLLARTYGLAIFFAACLLLSLNHAGSRGLLEGASS